MQDCLLANALEQTIRHYGHQAGALAPAAKHHLSSPGKRTRSQLLFAAAPQPEQTTALVHAAAAVELIHEASIVHDDIQDQTERRRGVKTVWRKFGANAALLLGDHLVAAAFRAIAEAPGVDQIKASLIVALSESVSRAASGQHLQLTNQTSGNAIAFYIDVAVNKTGALIALPLQFAAHFNHKVLADTSAARRCGEQLGLAYQILDDLKPYATPALLREDEDMQNRVITAPVAAFNSLFPSVDPFQALLSQTDRRDRAVRECQRWLDSALAKARYEAAFLSKTSEVVVEKFISQKFSYIVPAATERVSSFQPWQGATATRAEAV